MITGLKAAILVAIVITVSAATLWAVTLALIDGVEFLRWLRTLVREAKAASQPPSPPSDRVLTRPGGHK
jgi:hypothetical protein